MFDVVTFGEAMIRLSPPHFERFEQANSLDVRVGGGELNVAVGVSRLGLRSTWVSRLPKNPLGKLMENRARQAGVDTSNLVWSADGRMGLYFLEFGAAPRASSVVYDRAQSAISLVKPGEINWEKVFQGAKWFHTSGITPALSDSAAAVTLEALKAAKHAGATVSYDLNYRGKLWTPDKAQSIQEPMMEHVDVLMTTEEDTKVVFKITASDHTDDKGFAQVSSEPTRMWHGGSRRNSSSRLWPLPCEKTRWYGAIPGRPLPTPTANTLMMSSTNWKSWTAWAEATPSAPVSFTAA
jgi:2-dehydro-3-deoxygluconokinase